MARVVGRAGRNRETGNMLKRTFDVLWSLIGLALTALPMLILALWIKLDSRGPVFYRGLRAGRGDRPFRIFKFRTMVVDAEKIGPSATSAADPRITRPGRFLRRWKLDELPQLLNVLLGEMSFVGPRPDVQWVVDRYTDEQRQVLQLRPGITDWASIWNVDEGAVLAKAKDPDAAYLRVILPTKVALQLKYLRERSLWTDIRIICYTLVRMVWKNWTPSELAEYGRPEPVAE